MKREMKVIEGNVRRLRHDVSRQLIIPFNIYDNLFDNKFI